MDQELLGLSAEDFSANEAVTYSDVHGLLPLFDRVAFRSNLILSGPKGVGKSLSFQAWAQANSHSILTFDCTEDIRRSHLLGHYVQRGDSTPFALGALTNAFEVANESGSCILVFEEINALTPQLQKALSPLDFRRRVELPEIQRVFRLKPEARLWVCGTMNSGVYGGVSELNEDLKSRFRMIPLGYPSQEQEQKIISLLFPTWNLPEVQIGDRKVDLRTAVLQLALETRSGAFDYALSTRDVVHILEDILAAGLDNALWMSLGKFEESERDTYYQRLKSVFGPKVLGARAPRG